LLNHCYLNAGSLNIWWREEGGDTQMQIDQVAYSKT
jgi:hypothetical protein